MTLMGNNAITLRKLTSKVTAEKVYPLKAYDIPNTIVQSINVKYSNTQAVVLSPDGEADAFEILAGVRQGDTWPIPIHLGPWLCHEDGYWEWWGHAKLYSLTQKKPVASCKRNSRLGLSRWYCLAVWHTTSSPKLAVPSWKSCWLQSRTPDERLKNQIHGL